MLVDADPQGSLTAGLGFAEPDELKETLATVLMSVIANKYSMLLPVDAVVI